MIRTQPYQNRAIIGVIAAILTQTKLHIKCPDRFKTCIPDDLDRQEDEAPQVLVSIAATGVISPLLLMIL